MIRLFVESNANQINSYLSRRCLVRSVTVATSQGKTNTTPASTTLDSKEPEDVVADSTANETDIQIDSDETQTVEDLHKHFENSEDLQKKEFHELADSERDRIMHELYNMHH